MTVPAHCVPAAYGMLLADRCFAGFRMLVAVKFGRDGKWLVACLNALCWVRSHRAHVRRAGVRATV